MGLISPFLFLVAPEAGAAVTAGKSVVGVVGGVLGVVVNYGSTGGPASNPGVQPSATDLYFKTTTALGNYVNNMQLHLEAVYTNVFENGVNLTRTLDGGTFVNRTTVNLDCAHCVA